MPLLSVIVPAYNMEHFIVSCLYSLMLDSPPKHNDIQVIVVNDGSKDQTLAVVRKFLHAGRDAISIIDKENGNYGSCINAALQQVRGRYVRILDADDTFDVGEFRRFVNYLHDCDADLVLSDYVLVDCAGHVLARRCQKRRDDYGILDLLSDRNPLQMQAITYKARLLRDLGYRQTEGVSYTDTEWCIWPMSAVKTIMHSGCCVYRYLIGRSGQSVSQYYAKLDDLLRVLKDLLSNTPKYSHNACAPENAYFLARRVADHARFVTEVLIANCSLSELQRRYSHVCNMLTDFPEVRRMFFGYCILRKMGGVRLFALMRNHYWLVLPIVIAYRLRLRIGGGR